MTVNEVIQAAMQLTESERAEVLQVLADSLPEEVRDEYEKEWLEEINRRTDEYERDPSSALTWEQVKERTLRRLGRA